MKYIMDIDVDNISAAALYGMRTTYDDEMMGKILQYLKSFAPCKFTSAPVVDILTGEKVADADNGFSDGQYTWYVSEIYYFERYRLPLDQHFVEHVLTKI